MAARAPDRARRRLAGPDRPRGGPPGATPRPRGSSSQRDWESLAGAPRFRSERSGPIALVTMHGVDPSQFRQLLGRFATGVTVVTTRDRSGKPIGMTASSVASVSLDPPLVLVSVAHDNDMHPALKAADRFVVNVLAADQEAISRRFAEEHPNRFDGIGYRETRHGLPVLEGVLASIECEKQGEAPGGDHTVFFGLVTGGAVADRGPLLYYRGGYAALGGGAGGADDRERAAGRSESRPRRGREGAARYRAFERAVRRDAGGGAGTRALFRTEWTGNGNRETGNVDPVGHRHRARRHPSRRGRRRASPPRRAHANGHGPEPHRWPLGARRRPCG